MKQAMIPTGGMSCSGCESRIEHTLGRLEGVRRVKADRLSGRVEVAFDQRTEVPAIKQRIRELGYEVDE